MENLSTTGGKMYLVETTAPYKSLQIQFYPDRIQDVRTIESSDTQGVVGWNNTATHYTGGDDIVSMTLVFYSDDDRRKSALEAFRLLKSWGQSDAGRKGQKTLNLVWGDMFKRMKFVLVRQVKGDLSLFYKENNNNPSLIAVDITLKRVAPKPTSLKETRTL